MPFVLTRPKADQDLDEQAAYYALNGSAEVAHRFLVAADEAFQLLASQPKIGWLSKTRHRSLKSMRVFRVPGFEKMLILYLPHEGGAEILRVVHGARNLRVLIRKGGVSEGL